MGEVERKLRQVETDLKRVRDKSERFVSSHVFSYYEQELIRRVFKSVIKQMKSKQDINTAKEILRKTEWLD